MACPYFSPSESIADKVEGCRIRPPLGALYLGCCLARGVPEHPPDANTLNRGCNFGYARSICAIFPQHAEPDAVRFSVACDDGLRIEILFSIEGSHRPLRHGRLEFDRERQSWNGIAPDTILYDQAKAYLKSYLRWKSRKAGLVIPPPE